MPDGKGGIQFKTDLRIVQVIGEFLTKGADPFVYRVAVTVQVCSRSLNRTIAKQIFLQGDEIVALVFFFVIFCRREKFIGIGAQNFMVRNGQKDPVKSQFIKRSTVFPG